MTSRRSRPVQSATGQSVDESARIKYGSREHPGFIKSLEALGRNAEYTPLADRDSFMEEWRCGTTFEDLKSDWHLTPLKGEDAKKYKAHEVYAGDGRAYRLGLAIVTTELPYICWLHAWRKTTTYEREIALTVSRARYVWGNN